MQDVKEVAKELRAKLKQVFPAQKFSVRIDRKDSGSIGRRSLRWSLNK